MITVIGLAGMIIEWTSDTHLSLPKAANYWVEINSKTTNFVERTLKCNSGKFQ